MINFRSQSVDGFGDRDDLALERDRQQGQIRENKARELAELDEAVDRAREYGTSSDARPITQIVREMLEGERYSRLLLKSQVIWDADSISEALTEACIQLGLSDEEFSPTYHDQGNEIDIRLI